jgi:hypothetical protein
MLHSRSSPDCTESRAKKILVERVLADPCLKTLLARLESANSTARTEALTTLRYIFEFKHKTRSISHHYQLILDFQDTKTITQVLAFQLSHYESLLIALSHSIEDPFATHLAIQNITFLMRMHKQCRLYYARNPLFIEWRQNPRNPFYSLESVEGLLIISEDDPSEDIFLPEVQQFIYYIGEPYWPLQDLHPLRVVARFQRIWGPKRGDRPPVPPNNDLGERWFSDRESEGSEDGDYYDYQDQAFGDEFLQAEFLHEPPEFGDFLNEGGGLGLTEDWMQEPEIMTPEDLMAFFHVAEEAGLRSQERRRGGRRAVQEESPESQGEL